LAFLASARRKHGNTTWRSQRAASIENRLGRIEKKACERSHFVIHSVNVLETWQALTRGMLSMQGTQCWERVTSTRKRVETGKEVVELSRFMVFDKTYALCHEDHAPVTFICTCSNFTLQQTEKFKKGDSGYEEARFYVN
jgi:hypothetical protein